MSNSLLVTSFYKQEREASPWGKFCEYYLSILIMRENSHRWRDSFSPCLPSERGISGSIKRLMAVQNILKSLFLSSPDSLGKCNFLTFSLNSSLLVSLESA